MVDKTGTLTEGKPRLQTVHAKAGVAEERVLAVAAALELRSEHPLAKAILEGAQRRAACRAWSSPPSRRRSGAG